MQLYRPMMKKVISLLLFGALLAMPALQAQESLNDQGTKGPILKNTIRLNLTNPVFFGKRSLVIGYERIIKKNQSFSINIGQAALPKFLSLGIEGDSTIQINRSSKEGGFNISGDYRFYLGDLNKYSAPRGVYIGPYASYSTMGRENSWNLDTDNFQGEVITDLNFRFTAIGVQLGYQFVLWKRVALDLLLIGPGIANYSLEAKLNTTLDIEDEQALFEKINEILNEKFPGYTFTIDDVDFIKKGTASTTTLGYRYVIHLGFRF